MANLIAKYPVKSVVAIAPKVSLAEQIQEEFAKFLNEDIGICGGGKQKIRDITISTPESIPKNILEQAEMILYDELQFLASFTIFNTSLQAINAYYRFGASATPWRDDGTDLLLEAALNVRKPHLSINASKLIKKGKLTPCTINFIPINQQFNWPGNYNDLYNAAIVNNEYRNNRIVDLAIQQILNKKHVLILIKNINHGNKIKQMIEDKMKNNNIVKFIHGSTSNEERNNIINETKKGNVPILIGSTIADAGLDIPILDTLILAGGGSSSTTAFQRIGRVLRLYEGKTDATVYDFMDKTPTLYNHFLVRKELYTTEPEWKINILNS